MLKIWNAAFWKPLPTDLEPFADGAAAVTPERVADTRLALAMVAPIVLLVACSVALTVAAGPAFELVEAAAVQLMEPAGYIEAVLGGAGR
jgi:multicomponent Na+:H+ antiporter subunit D